MMKIKIKPDIVYRREYKNFHFFLMEKKQEIDVILFTLE